MQFTHLLFWCLALLSTAHRLLVNAVHYDDDNTNRKVQLADLENEQEEKQQLQQQQLPFYTAPRQQQQQQHSQQQKTVQQQQRQYHKNHHAQYTQPTRAFSFRPPTPTAEPQLAANTPDDYQQSQYSLENVQQIVYNDISSAQNQEYADLPRIAPVYTLSSNVIPAAVQHALLQQREQAQQAAQHQQQQQQTDYAVKEHQSGEYMLAQPYDTEEADGAAVSAEQQQQQQNQLQQQQQVQLQQQQLQQQQQQQQQHLPPHLAYLPSALSAHGYTRQKQQSIVSYSAPNEAAPTIESTSSAHNDFPDATDTAATIAAGNAGVHYVSSNHLMELNSDDIDNDKSNIFIPNNLQRPIILYRTLSPSPSPPVNVELPLRRPHLLTHSKQYAFAPARGEEGRLSPYTATIPYPPSFISITSTTTRRPDHAIATVQRPDAYARYARPFRPSPVDPLPDLFSHRQSKSLLDSYIPSWIIAQMLQQPSYRPPAYTSAIPYKRHYKRQLQQTQALTKGNVPKVSKKSSGT